ncbi:hypothetical protein GQ457_15G009900 [Hibiscus cannabinus]
MDNQVENPNLGDHVNFGGRPSDPGDQVGLPIALERPSEPVTAEDERLAKRVKNHGERENLDSEEVVEMEADGVDGEVGQLESRVQIRIDQHGQHHSYASVVARDSVRMGNSSDEHCLNPDDIVVRDEDCIVTETGDFPTIKFSERIHDQIDHSMKNVIIVRLLGRNIGYDTLLNRLHALWKPLGEIQLIDLENNYFLVRFEDRRDYSMVLTDGPWTIYGNYLTVQPWSRSFSTSEKHPSHVVVWVRLPGLPYRYYCKALFQRIAQVVGKVVKVDYNTQAGERGKFARLAVMVDLNKPLKPCIGIDNFVQNLEYEGLQQICFACGVYGHTQEVCTVGGNGVCASSSRAKDSVDQMVASGRRRWSAQNASREGRNEAVLSGLSSRGGSRFNVLRDEGLVALAGEGRVETVVVDTSGGSVQGDESGKEVLMHDSSVIDQGRQNVATFSVNHECRSKTGPGSSIVEPVVDVVTLTEGGSSEARVHQVKSKSGNHRALSIIEHDADGKSVARPRMGSGSTSKNRFYNENRSRSFQVQKGGDNRGPNRVVLADWIQSAANRIDSLANTVHHSPSKVGMEVEVTDPGGSESVLVGRGLDAVVGNSIDGVVHDGGGNLSS